MCAKMNKVYLAILHYGLINIRDAAYQNNTHLCEIEADHLHNLPKLVFEEDLFQHKYYFEKEKELYLERINNFHPVNGSVFSFTLCRYKELWKQLEIILTGKVVQRDAAAEDAGKTEAEGKDTKKDSDGK